MHNKGCQKTNNPREPFEGLAISELVKASAVGATERTAELESLARDLKEAVRVRDEFISLASHELKTPLTAIDLQVQLVEEVLKKKGIEAFTADKLAAICSILTTQIRNLTALVDDMLDISRIAGSRLFLEMGEHNLSELVNEAVGTLKVAAEKKGSLIGAEIEESITGRFDRRRIEQVIANILANAVKFGKGKPICVKLKKKQKGIAVLEVADKGIGIPKEAQERIFERFERTDAARYIRGLGMGLFISKNIVIAHGGNITVRSEEDKGSTFTIEIPLCPS